MKSSWAFIQAENVQARLLNEDNNNIYTFQDDMTRPETFDSGAEGEELSRGMDDTWNEGGHQRRIKLSFHTLLDTQSMSLPQRPYTTPP